MYSYYAQVIGLFLNFLGGVLLLWYSPSTMSAGGVTVTHHFEKKLVPEFKVARRWFRIGICLFIGGFVVQAAGMVVADNQTTSLSVLMNSYRKAAGIAVGYLVALLMGRRVQALIDKVTMKPIAPDGIPQAELDRALLIGEEDVATARRIGFMERALFFFSIYFEAYFLAGGWLTLKVASKWATWQNIVKMPDTFPYNPDDAKADVLKAFRVKNQWGGRLLNRFMVGTFYNLMCGLSGGS